MSWLKAIAFMPWVGCTLGDLRYPSNGKVWGYHIPRDGFVWCALRKRGHPAVRLGVLPVSAPASNDTAGRVLITDQDVCQP